jgi:hypothetical protein
MTTGLGPTQPSGIAQQLLIRSLERALGQLDFQRLVGHTVDLEVFVQAGNQGLVSPGLVGQAILSQGFVNQGFVKEFVVMWLKSHGVRVATVSPELRLKMFVAVLGTDRGETLIGLPAFQAPILNVPIPEIALFKWTRNRGQSELRVFAVDGKTDDFVEQLPIGVGHAKSDDFTLLLFIGFSSADVDQRAP